MNHARSFFAAAFALAVLAFTPARAQQSVTHALQLMSSTPQPFVLCDQGLATSPAEPIVWDETHAPMVFRIPKCTFGPELAAVEIVHADRISVTSWGLENKKPVALSWASQQFTFLWQLSIRPQNRAPFTTLLDSPILPGTPPGTTYVAGASSISAWDGLDDCAGASGETLPGTACTLPTRTILITDPAVLLRFRLAARNDPGYVHIALDAYAFGAFWYGDTQGSPAGQDVSGTDGHDWSSGCRATLSVTGSVRYIRATP